MPLSGGVDREAYLVKRKGFPAGASRTTFHASREDGKARGVGRAMSQKTSPES